MCSPALDLETGRDSGGKLYQLVVEKGGAGLERDRHAHAVDLCQNVAREIRLAIDHQEPVERIVAGRPLAVLAELIDHSHLIA